MKRPSFTLKFRYELRGAHFHIDTFVGPTGGTLAKAGTLAMYADEMKALANVLEVGAIMVNGQRHIYPFEIEVKWEG